MQGVVEEKNRNDEYNGNGDLPPGQRKGGGERRTVQGCQIQDLNQVDLLSPSLEKMSEQEYHAKRRGQVNLDFANFELTLEGLTPMRTTFETEKEKIRKRYNRKPKEIKGKSNK